MSDQEIVKLLTDIRDSQKAMLEEYRIVAGESLKMQREAFENQKNAIAQQARAVGMQAQTTRIYKVSLGVIALVIAFLVYRLLELT